MKLKLGYYFKKIYFDKGITKDYNELDFYFKNCIFFND